MTEPARATGGMTLERFLRRRDIDESPSAEFFQGRAVRKVAPQLQHCALSAEFVQRINQYARPVRLGLAFIELRCTFAGQSVVPDVVYLRDASIEVDERGQFVDETLRPPDIHVEILSPKQSPRRSHEKILFSIEHGCGLGLLIAPKARTIDVYRPSHDPERLADDGAIVGDPVLPGFGLPVAEVFGWLVYRRPTGPGPA